MSRKRNPAGESEGIRKGVASYALRVTSYALRVTGYELRVTGKKGIVDRSQITDDGTQMTESFNFCPLTSVFCSLYSNKSRTLWWLKSIKYINFRHFSAF